MKKGIHPENYRLVAFKDMSNGDVFLTKSTANTKENLEVDGVEYPLIKLEISRTSHPFYTGKSKLIDAAGRIDKFKTQIRKIQERLILRILNILKKPRHCRGFFVFNCYCVIPNPQLILVIFHFPSTL